MQEISLGVFKAAQAVFAVVVGPRGGAGLIGWVWVGSLWKSFLFTCLAFSFKS